MAMHKFCTKCRSAKPLATIGTNGVCKDCMIEAIESSQQAKEELGNGTDAKESVQFMVAKEGVQHNFETKKELAAFLGVSMQKVSAAIRFGKDVDGWELV